MITNLFELFNNIDTLKNTNIERLDFSKKEDLDKAKKYLEDIEKNEFVSLLLGDEVIQRIRNYINESYAKLKKDEPERPSLKVNEEIRKNIAKLVQEYTNTIIFPYLQEKNINDKQKRDIVDSLYEFACWMYNK